MSTDSQLLLTSCGDIELNSGPTLLCRPKLHELDLLEGSDGKRVRVLKDGASKWRDIAIRLHFKQCTITEISTESSGNMKTACIKVFSIWLDGDDELRSPTTWETVIKALKEAGLGHLAENLKSVLTENDRSLAFSLSIPSPSHAGKYHEVMMLKEYFLSMQERLQSEIENNSEVSPEMLVASLPESLQYEYQQFVCSNSRALNSIGALFCHLKPYFTIIDYQVLECLINGYGSAKLMMDMLAYSRRVQIFMQTTTIQQVIDREWSQRDIPSHFATLTTPMNISIEESLLRLDSIKHGFCNKCRIETACLSLHKIVMMGDSGIAVNWMLPSTLCSNLKRRLIELSELSDLVLRIGDKDNGWSRKGPSDDDKDDDRGGVLSRKRGSKATNEDVTKRSKQDYSGKQTKKYYEMLLKIAILFGDTFLPIRKEKKLHQLQRREPMARSIQLQYC